ncbi:MAG: PTS sugar transporter subunit IIB [Collinsella sp.]
MIVGARIDFRLIHGRVANLGLTRQVSRFMVVDDEVSQDATQKQVLRMACPATVKLSVLPSTGRCQHHCWQYDAQRLFIVAKKPEVYVRLLEQGVKLEQLIVGNMTTMEPVKKLSRNISCDQGTLIICQTQGR